MIASIEECDRLGPEEFRARYHYGPARQYLLVHDGREYDSKAIVGVAHKAVDGRPLRASEFTGGDQTVGRLLSRLHFDVRRTRNPPWTREEVVLACDLVAENGWRWLDETDSRVQELSALLRRLPIVEPHERAATFRNAAGVARKTADIATQHPDYTGRATRGGSTDREVLQDFLDRPSEMHALAATIRAAAAAGELDFTPVEFLDDDTGALEGGLLERLSRKRERNRTLRNQKIKKVQAAGLPVACEACGFDFGRVYGERGEGYIEVHHVVPLHVTGLSRTGLSDLALLCANCHRMIHKKSPWLSVDELRSLLA